MCCGLSRSPRQCTLKFYGSYGEGICAEVVVVDGVVVGVEVEVVGAVGVELEGGCGPVEGTVGAVEVLAVAEEASGGDEDAVLGITWAC